MFVLFNCTSCNASNTDELITLIDEPVSIVNLTFCPLIVTFAVGCFAIVRITIVYIKWANLSTFTRDR